MSLAEVDSLNLDDFGYLQKAMVAIEAKELLSLASVLDFPHLSNKGRKQLVQKLERTIKSSLESGNKRSLTNEELFRIISGVTKDGG